MSVCLVIICKEKSAADRIAVLRVSWFAELWIRECIITINAQQFATFSFNLCFINYTYSSILLHYLTLVVHSIQEDLRRNSF